MVKFDKRIFINNNFNNKKKKIKLASKKLIHTIFIKKKMYNDYTKQFYINSKKNIYKYYDGYKTYEKIDGLTLRQSTLIWKRWFNVINSKWFEFIYNNYLVFKTSESYFIFLRIMIYNSKKYGNNFTDSNFSELFNYIGIKNFELALDKKLKTFKYNGKKYDIIYFNSYNELKFENIDNIDNDFYVLKKLDLYYIIKFFNYINLILNNRVKKLNMYLVNNENI